jgi:hypothetical protein
MTTHIARARCRCHADEVSLVLCEVGDIKCAGTVKRRKGAPRKLWSAA